MKKVINVLAMFLTIINVNASAATSDHSETTDNVYTEKQTNIVVTADHPEFTLKLRANPTTGYSWYLREYDSKLITPVKHAYQRPDSKLVGAGGVDLWTFRLMPAAFVVPQQTALRMVYVRPWQNDASGMQVVFRVSTQ